jgi:hypothetical protein
MSPDKVTNGGAEARVLIEYSVEGILQYLLSVVLQIKGAVF